MKRMVTYPKGLAGQLLIAHGVLFFVLSLVGCNPNQVSPRGNDSLSPANTPIPIQNLTVTITPSVSPTPSDSSEVPHLNRVTPTATASTSMGVKASDPQPTHQLPIQPPPANSQNITMYVTSYGYDDNDDGNGHFGTAVIAYPRSDGNPTLHNIATEGSGTYNDPITFAAAVQNINAGIFPVGSIIYAPYLQKYFILEDQCADCGNDLQGTQEHIDLWMGPSSTSNKTVLDNCESKITRNTNIMLKPPANLPVDTTPLFQNNQCTAHIH